MKKLLFFLFITYSICVTAKTVDDSEGVVAKITKHFSMEAIQKTAQAATAHLEEYRPCLKPTISAPMYKNNKIDGIINTPMAGLILATGLGYGLCVPAPHLKLAFLVALVAPYATEVCIKTTAQNMVITSNSDSQYKISDIAAQNSLLATFGD